MSRLVSAFLLGVFLLGVTACSGSSTTQAPVERPGNVEPKSPPAPPPIPKNPPPIM